MGLFDDNSFTIPAGERELEQDPHTSPITIPTGEFDLPADPTDDVKKTRKPRAPKETGGVTKATISNLLDALKPTPAPVEHPAVAIRKARTETMKANVAAFADHLVAVNELLNSGDLPAVERALKAFAAAAEATAKAIAAIPDSKVTLADEPPLKITTVLSSADKLAGAEVNYGEDGEAVVTKPKRPARAPKPTTVDDEPLSTYDETVAAGGVLGAEVIAAAELDDEVDNSELPVDDPTGF